MRKFFTSFAIVGALMLTIGLGAAFASHVTGYSCSATHRSFREAIRAMPSSFARTPIPFSVASTTTSRK